MTSSSTPARIRVKRLTVRSGRLEAEVEVYPPGAHSTPALARMLREMNPRLAGHACVNDVGDCFGDVMDHTPLPHVLEHLAVDAQAQEYRAHASADEGKVFVGTSEWIDDERTVARVCISFVDDLAALRALREATAVLKSALEQCVDEARCIHALCDD